MFPIHRWAATAALLLALPLASPAQTRPPHGTAKGDEAPAAADTRPTALDAELFYQLLLGELSARDGEGSTAFSLLLDAARKTGDAALYQRAIEVAFQSRAGEAALQAARTWKRAQPDSADANRYVLQILIVLNRIADTAEPLRTSISLAPADEKASALSSIPRIYARVTDKRLAARTVEQALSEHLAAAATAAPAWTTVGRMRLAAGDTAGALEAARRAQGADGRASGPAILAIELMDARQLQAEPLVQRYLDGAPMPEIRMGYARTLLDLQRYADAARQLTVITAQRPDFAEAWLVQGTLQVQDNQPEAAQASLERYITLAQAQPTSDERSRGMAQAYLSLSQLAQQRKDFDKAQEWLGRIENSAELMSAQTRRASILASQGRVEEARALIRALPERTPADGRSKLLAEVSLLRDQKQYREAYALLDKATQGAEFDADLVYEQAMLADKAAMLPEMERLLRQVIEKQPDYHHAYNALGYSLAERGERLPEARTLILKALEHAPNDPFITDSLAWVEFRMGHHAQAQRLLEQAFKTRPDAEIAAHLGEVLWVQGLKDKALAIWREGLTLNSENETLQETLKRLRATP